MSGEGGRTLLSGCYCGVDEDKEVAGLFQVLYGKPDGTFRKAEALKGTDGEPLIIPLDGQSFIENICTRPFAVDWDGDGHVDVATGSFAATFCWLRGVGQGGAQPHPGQP